MESVGNGDCEILKIMSKHILLSLVTALVILLFIACENKNKDLTPPAIIETDFLPADCDIYYTGDTIQVRFTCSDDTELGNFNIEIHSNFDHHTHSTSAEECGGEEGEEHHHDEEGEEHHHHEDVEGAWVFNQDYAIPAGQKRYTVSVDIPVPEEVLDGDYHFMLRLTDQSGWQTIKAVAVRLKLR